jgi:hypothetical protein
VPVEEVETLSAVLDLAEKRGVRLRAVVCGSIKLAFDAPWPPEEAAKPRVLSEKERHKEALRKASVENFGRVLSDELLEEYHKDGLL